jgi:serine/threonine protein kinase
MEVSLPEIHRPLIPLSELGWYKGYICGIPDSPPKMTSQLNKQTSNIDLNSVYTPQEILHGDDAEKSRFVFSEGSLISEGGSGEIYHAIDRLTGEKGIAKVTLSRVYDNYRQRFNSKIQLEGEIMTALAEDSYLSKHIVKVWDISNVLIKGKESMVLFEEEMNPSKQPILFRAQELSKLPTYERLNLIEQLCTTIDRLDKHGIYHHDLSYKNIYIDFKNMQVKIGDFGGSNFANNVKLYGVEANPIWVSPERQRYLGGKKDPGLVSEVFVLTALSYYIMTAGDFPYNVGYNRNLWPSDRSQFNNKSRRFKTGFYPDSRNDLKKYAPKNIGEAQLDQMANVFERGLAIDPKDRYQSGKELFEALQNVIYPKNKVISFVRD